MPRAANHAGRTCPALRCAVHAHMEPTRHLLYISIQLLQFATDTTLECGISTVTRLCPRRNRHASSCAVAT
ncbi:hypothetical protein CNECB9_4270002 [Cupriavidus necator]|uniref:Uncharacterized protein n=1 Tax=Cupriavidus necator TaxID=106590 RepID=A0A1K0IY23_CUPNE|nr:hypothetical protein CNECB9_4270002 [Cupriavidus necator]